MTVPTKKKSPKAYGRRRARIKAIDELRAKGCIASGWRRPTGTIKTKAISGGLPSLGKKQ